MVEVGWLPEAGDHKMEMAAAAEEAGWLLEVDQHKMTVEEVAGGCN